MRTLLLVTLLFLAGCGPAAYPVGPAVGYGLVGASQNYFATQPRAVSCFSAGGGQMHCL